MQKAREALQKIAASTVEKGVQAGVGRLAELCCGKNNRFASTSVLSKRSTHHSHPSQRSARCICWAAASTSIRRPVLAAFSYQLGGVIPMRSRLSPRPHVSHEPRGVFKGRRLDPRSTLRLDHARQLDAEIMFVGRRHAPSYASGF
jgi:hypothetical protein